MQSGYSGAVCNSRSDGTRSGTQHHLCLPTCLRIGFVFFGKLMDRIATRRGFSWSVWPWSIAAMAHALGSARSATTDMGVRAWQIHDRSYPVAVSVLAARLLI